MKQHQIWLLAITVIGQTGLVVYDEYPLWIAALVTVGLGLFFVLRNKFVKGDDER